MDAVKIKHDEFQLNGLARNGLVVHSYRSSAFSSAGHFEIINMVTQHSKILLFEHESRFFARVC